MAKGSKPPKTYRSFVERYPELGQAWELVRRAEGKGSLDEKTCRLVKLGIAIGGMREGAVHSAVRKALGAGVSREEISQVVALAASTLGFPSTVAVYSWIDEQVEDTDKA
jgi:alkylhydroperoxidase/carboxymuconolactone decarboxylase family protein YurZ